MACLVCDHVIRKGQWRHDEAPIQTDMPSCVAAAPSLGLIDNLNCRLADPEELGHDFGSCGKMVLCTVLVPNAQTTSYRRASDQLIRAHRHRCDKVRSTDDNARHHGGGIGYDLEPISTP